jgi:transcriptional regulator with XRE-family HTH domain
MNLGKVLADYRWANRLGVRELAKEMGITSATLNRIEQNENCNAASLIAIIDWLLIANAPHRRKRLKPNGVKADDRARPGR